MKRQSERRNTINISYFLSIKRVKVKVDTVNVMQRYDMDREYTSKYINGVIKITREGHSRHGALSVSVQG